ncbi:MAG: malonyl CoA-acyl carrier protein transacylase, partial [Campylobacter sp.]|nr:malonyl CoA-acyl carrier protein transacylase [Campylobacter sp.]
KEKALELLQKQLTSPVLYKQSIKACESEIDAFIEFGANVLSGLNKKISAKSTYSVFDMASLEATLSALKG